MISEEEQRYSKWKCYIKLPAKAVAGNPSNQEDGIIGCWKSQVALGWTTVINCHPH